MLRHIWIYSLIACFIMLGSSGGWAQSLEEADSQLKFPTTQEEIVTLFGEKPPDSVAKPRGGLRSQGNDSALFGNQARGLGGIADDEVVNEAILEHMMKVGALVLFDYDSATVEDDSEALLEEFARAFQNDLLKDAIFVIAGHTDSKGSLPYNVTLSRRRARAVKEYLVTNHQIGEERLLIKPYGEEKPIASNETLDGRAMNRRVEFIRIQ